MRQALVTLAATLSLALTWCPAHAHHSHFYDECKTITIEGRVESAAFKNPHNLIVLRLDDRTAFAVDWNYLAAGRCVTPRPHTGLIGTDRFCHHECPHLDRGHGRRTEEQPSEPTWERTKDRNHRPLMPTQPRTTSTTQNMAEATRIGNFLARCSKSSTLGGRS